MLGLLAQSAAAQTRPAAAHPPAPAAMPPGWDQIDERLVFLTIRLSSVEASIQAMDKAIKATGYTKASNAEIAEHARKGNELMDRNGGCPLPWQDFYGRTARDFYFHPGLKVEAHATSGSGRETESQAEQVGTPTAIQRPPQLDYIYKANTDNQKRAEAAAAELGGKIDQLLERRRRLESEQNALWARIAFRAVSSRELATKSLYRFKLKSATESKVSIDQVMAIQAICEYIRTVDQLMADAQASIEADPASVLNELSKGVSTARNTLDNQLVQNQIIAVDLADTSGKLSHLVRITRRLDDLAQNVDEACRLAKEGDTAGDTQRKDTFRSQLQDGLLNEARAMLTADLAVTELIDDWKLAADLAKPATAPSQHLSVPNSVRIDNTDTEHAAHHPPDANVQQSIPSIKGRWQEGPGVVITISQENGTWTAQCIYKSKGSGEIRWEINDGTVTADGKVHGKLRHTKAPASWTTVQIRDGVVSKDGQIISGTASFDNTSQAFTWTKLKAQEK